jgi:4-diphosphocytidyl-2-C-methyl-D-erythritol kinase
MQAVDLCDDVAVSYECGDTKGKIPAFAGMTGRAGMSSVTINVSMTAEPFVTESIDTFIPDKEDNIAYKAAALYCLMYCPDLTGEINIEIHKRIPAAAGLAGGSADAAAVVLALDHLLTGGDYHTLEELAGFAVSLGADVPFCIASAAKNNPKLAYELLYEDEYSIMTSSALCEGIGEIITPTPSARGRVILIKPALEVSTPHIYKLYDKTEHLSSGTGTDSLLTLWDENVLEPVTVSAYPAMAGLIADVRRIASGASFVYMTGSGPTVVAVYPEGGGDADADADADSLRAEFKHRTDIRAVLVADLL